MSHTKKLSNLRKFCGLEELNKSVNCIHNIELRPYLKVLFKLESDRIKISI